MRPDRKRKPASSSIRKRRIVRNSDSPDEEEDEAMVGTPDPTKGPAQIQGKRLDD